MRLFTVTVLNLWTLAFGVPGSVFAADFDYWQQRYRPGLTRFGSEVSEPRVQVLEPGIGARTLGEQILISDQASLDLRPALVRHEKAHVFFNRACPGLANTPGIPFVAEAFAQWASQDEGRIIGTNANGDLSGVYLSQAIAWAKEFGIQKEPDPARMDLSVARILVSLRSSEARVDGYFQELFLRCQAGEGAGQFSKGDLSGLIALAIQPSESAGRSAAEFLFLNGATGELAGDIKTADLLHPAASVTKPFLIGLSGKIPEAMSPGQGALWECMKLPGLRGLGRVSWKEALQGSCNGYFVGPDAEFARTPSFRSTWIRFWQSVGAMGMADFQGPSQAIGLLPGARLSLKQLLAAYIRLDERRGSGVSGQEVLEALRKTPSVGTLAGTAVSDWFVLSGIGLKSGTVRDGVGRPEHGWIVAVGPRDSRGHLLWVAAIHQSGSSPALLLGEFQQRLREILARNAHSDFDETQVQLTPLVPEARIEVGCRDTGGMIYSGQGGDWNYLKPGEWIPSDRQSPGDRFACGVGPILLRSSAFSPEGGAPGFHEYDGRWIRWESLPAPGPSAKERIAPGAQRARRGSRLVLSTGLNSYIQSVVASEYAVGREAALEVLARAAVINAQGGAPSRHPGRNALCDSTHCQTFRGRWQDGVAGPVVLRISNAVRAALNWDGPVVKADSSWIPFSRGGQEPWSRTVGISDINMALHLGLDSPSVLAELQKLRVRSCDRLRGALQLLSCPTEILVNGSAIEFKGQGAGHGLGLDLVIADKMAAQGSTAQEIWSAFFGRSRAASSLVEPYH